MGTRMIHGVAGQLVLLVCDSATADKKDEVCRAADGGAYAANYGAAIGLASRQRCTPRSLPDVSLSRFRPLYR